MKVCTALNADQQQREGIFSENGAGFVRIGCGRRTAPASTIFAATVTAFQADPVCNNDFFNTEWKNGTQPIFIPPLKKTLGQLVRYAFIVSERHCLESFNAFEGDHPAPLADSAIADLLNL